MKEIKPEAESVLPPNSARDLTDHARTPMTTGTGVRIGGCRVALWSLATAIVWAAVAAQAPAASAAASVVLASGDLQRCLGITPGQTAFSGATPANAQYCRQLPGAAAYDQAGRLYQSGDHVGAARLASAAADAGNPLAELRLAMLYEAGDGVTRNKTLAFKWYERAASVGGPAAQSELGGYYEDGDGVRENWPLAAQLYRASAQQGWVKGQFALARAYQFGIGVPQNRSLAVNWFSAAGAQGHGAGAYFARWLRDPTNNIGFRTQAEHDLVIGSRLRFALLSGDPSGITFRNSPQRTAWLTGQRVELDAAEAHTMWQIRADEYNQCRSGGSSNCISPGTDPQG